MKEEMRYTQEWLSDLQAQVDRLTKSTYAEPGDTIEVDGTRYLVSGVLDDGSAEVMERLLVGPSEYTVVRRGKEATRKWSTR